MEIIKDGMVVTPCAGCRVLRRKCSVETCIYAPYFPPNDPHKFLCVHKIFGASNINRLLQEIPENQREDAVSSLVYEASVRVKDPVYGSSGVVYNLHRLMNKLQHDLATIKAQILNMHLLQQKLNSIICDMDRSIRLESLLDTSCLFDFNNNALDKVSEAQEFD